MENENTFDRVDIDFEAIANSLQGSNQVVIYGVNPMAMITMLELSLINIPTVFFADEAPDRQGYFGRPVLKMTDIPPAISLNPLVIIAKKLDDEEPIRDAFRQRGYFKFFSLKTLQYVNRQRQRRIEMQWLSQIARMINVSSDKPVDAGMKMQMLLQMNHNKELRKAVFVSLNLSARSYKIMKAVQKQGIKVDYIHVLGGAADPSVRESVIAEADSYSETGSHIDLLIRLMTSQASFVHLFSHAWSPELMCIMSYLIYKKKFLPTVVFDQYDVGRLYTNFPQLTYANEQFCMENADIVTDRSFEVDYLIEHHDCKLQRPKVQLFDGCDERIQAPYFIIKDDAPLRLCYAGGLVNVKVQDDWDWTGLAKYCEEKRCHIDVYPAPGNWRDPNYKQRFEEFFIWDREIEFFNLHNPVPYANLVKTLNQYDYGTHPMKRVGEHSTADQLGYYTKWKRVYASSNHFFDYISAGLPIIANRPERTSKYFESLGIGINYAVEDYDFEFLKANRQKYRERVKEVRPQLYTNNLVKPLLELILPI